MNSNEEVFYSYEDAIQSFDPYKNDPRSVYYKRVHSIPKINWIKCILNIVLPIIILVIVYFIVVNCFKLIDIKYLIIVGLALLYIIYLCLRMKSIVIWLVKAYQHFAPIRVRDKCRFEPSCSEYMILSVEKYGVIKGVKKGVHRIYRCSHKDGGYDYP